MLLREKLQFCFPKARDSCLLCNWFIHFLRLSPCPPPWNQGGNFWLPPGFWGAWSDLGWFGHCPLWLHLWLQKLYWAVSWEGQGVGPRLGGHPVLGGQAKRGLWQAWWGGVARGPFQSP